MPYTKKLQCYSTFTPTSRLYVLQTVINPSCNPVTDFSSLMVLPRLYKSRILYRNSLRFTLPFYFPSFLINSNHTSPRVCKRGLNIAVNFSPGSAFSLFLCRGITDFSFPWHLRLCHLCGSNFVTWKLRVFHDKKFYFPKNLLKKKDCPRDGGGRHRGHSWRKLSQELLRLQLFRVIKKKKSSFSD